MVKTLLRMAQELAAEFLGGLSARKVGAQATARDLVTSLGALPEEAIPADAVIADLARTLDPGLIASAGPRYFGFVIGGSLPVALAADWLTSAWDQNAQAAATSPEAAAIEMVVASWVLDLLGWPTTSSVGFVTGAQMASFTGLAAARLAVLRREGWDVAQDGLGGAPHIDIVFGAEAHGTIHSALRMLGFGRRAVREVETDDQGRMSIASLARALEGCSGPAIVCAQVGNVNTGVADDLAAVVALTRARPNSWLHVDGAFGL